MKWRSTPFRVRVAILAIVGGLSTLCLLNAEQEPVAPKKSVAAGFKQIWTVQEAIAQLRLHPRDPYLQYVALQLARRDGQIDQVSREVQSIMNRGRWNRRNERAERVDLFSIFTGALAVQESLQLDTMRGQDPSRPVRRSGRDPQVDPKERAEQIVQISKLTGPTIKSHPWEKMLAGRNPEVSPLSKKVPEDYYYIEFASLTKLLQIMEAGDLWSLHLFSQTTNEARTKQVGDRLREQLAIESNRFLRPVYDKVVKEVVVTGSDLFVSEGSDVTLLFDLTQPALFKSRMDSFLSKAEKTEGAKRTTGEYLGVKYDHITTPERKVHVFSAYPEENLHIRSNSKAAFYRVLAALRGKSADGQAVARLGDSTEFKYIRTLMPRGAEEEDGFVYLSDPFIRRVVGPKLKLTERRRMLCYNHLRMIGHAALLYRTEYGELPASLEALAKTQCCPGTFNQGNLKCGDGGTYTLSADGSQGVCSHHGHAQNLTPNCELELAWVTGTEADQYNAFLREYNSYWRTFFDPIALRIQATPKAYRLETIVLPLINNSIYNGLAMALNGNPEQLDALPVPKRNIFTVAGRFNKEALLQSDIVKAEAQLRRQAARDLNIPEAEAAKLDLLDFVENGIGNQIALNLCDNTPTFDLNTLEFFGMMFGNFNGWNSVGTEELIASFMISALNSPVYVSVPVKDEKVVDDFLDQLDKVIAVVARQKENVGGWFRFSQDFYRAKLDQETTMRGYALSLGPVKWRFFWARVGKGFYVASKPFILKDLLTLHKAGDAGKAKQAAPAHAMLRMRAEHWNRVMEDYRLGWSENARKACLHNLGPLSSVGRAVLRTTPEGTPEVLGKKAWSMADRFHAVHFFCPEGGTYRLDGKNKVCTCSIHGGAATPMQPLEPTAANSTAKTLENLGEVTATLTFLEDGLHAVLTIERK